MILARLVLFMCCSSLPSGSIFQFVHSAIVQSERSKDVAKSGEDDNWPGGQA